MFFAYHRMPRQSKWIACLRGSNRGDEKQVLSHLDRNQYID